MPILPHVFKKGQKKEAKNDQSIREKQKKQAAQEKDKKEISSSDKKTKKKRASSSVKSDRAHAAYRVLVRPHISEKSVSRNNDGKYVFEIYPGSNKNEIAQAVEEAYGVKVDSVNKIKTHQKTKRYRFQQGTSTRLDKAVVTLKKGQEIEVLPH